MTNLNQKYNSNTVQQNDNIFLISKFREAVGAKNISKLTDIELNSKKILKENTNFREEETERGTTSVNESYFHMSQSLLPPRVVSRSRINSQISTTS